MRSINKGVFFIILIAILGGILVARSNFFEFNSTPQLIDRLPESDYLVRLKSLQFSKEINPILFKYKLPIREFASPEFMLGQAKHHGINIQTAAYLFFNEARDEWGALVQLNDSSKVINGIDRFRKNTVISDSSTDEVRIFHFHELNIKIAYEKNYLFVYSGNLFSRRLTEVQHVRTGEVRPLWKRFLKKKEFRKENLVVYSESEGLKSWGFDYGLFAHDNDTTGLHVKCYLYNRVPHGISKKSNALGVPKTDQDSKAIELHISPKIKDSKTGQKMIGKLHEMGKKISFPTRTFFDHWGGDLSFREGGVVASTQRIVTSEFDENFNVREVIKNQRIQVPGYIAAFNTNSNVFINSLFGKGLLRSEEQKLRFLFSPLLSMKHDNSFYIFTSSSHFPRLITNPGNYIVWEYEGTPVNLRLGNIKKRSIELQIDFPVKPLIKYLQRKKNRKKKSKPL
ncbi:MAG: hypothetical protein RL365_1539 [Bacteroidota bacterium]